VLLNLKTAGNREPFERLGVSRANELPLPMIGLDVSRTSGCFSALQIGATGGTVSMGQHGRGEISLAKDFAISEVMANMVQLAASVESFVWTSNVAARSAEMEMMGRLGWLKPIASSLASSFRRVSSSIRPAHHRAVMLGGTLAVRHRNRRQKINRQSQLSFATPFCSCLNSPTPA